MSCFGALGWSWSQGCALFMRMSASRPEAAGVVQSRRRSATRWASYDANVQRRAAITAEDAGDVVAADGFRDIRFGVPWRMRKPALGTRAAGTFAAPLWRWQSRAMTAQAEDGFAHGFIADCATEAAACSRVGHGRSPVGLLIAATPGSRRWR